MDGRIKGVIHYHDFSVRGGVISVCLFSERGCDKRVSGNLLLGGKVDRSLSTVYKKDASKEAFSFQRPARNEVRLHHLGYLRTSCW